MRASMSPGAPQYLVKAIESSTPLAPIKVNDDSDWAAERVADYSILDILGNIPDLRTLYLKVACASTDTDLYTHRETAL